MLYIVMIAWMGIASSLAIKFVPLIRRLNSDQSSRYKSLDALRGFLAAGVFISHAFVAKNFYKTGEWAPPESNMYRFAGTGSVALFFMITGLLFWGKVIDRKIEPLTLLRSRLMRIMPLHIFSCIIIFFICFYESNFTAAVQLNELIFNMLRWLGGGGALGAPSINGVPTLTVNAGVTWTLQYEWVFYALLPLIGIFVAPLRFALFVTLYLSVFVVLKSIGLSGEATYLLVASPFLGGMFAAYIAKYYVDSLNSNGFFQSLFVIASLVAGAYFYTKGVSTVIAVLLVPAFVLIATGNNIFGLLETGWARWLGQISFSIYILHGIVLLLCLRVVNGYLPITQMGPTVYTATCAIIAIFLVAICSVTYLAIERRFMGMPGRQK